MRGHAKRVTGLAFSMKLDILVSSGADGQVTIDSFIHNQKKSSHFCDWIIVNTLKNIAICSYVLGVLKLGK